MIHCEYDVFKTFKQKLEKSERVNFANIRKKNMPGRQIIANYTAGKYMKKLYKTKHGV